MDVLALRGTDPTRTKIAESLVRFYESAAACGLPEMERLANTVSTWWPQILAAITTGVTNAAPEGINRLIKTDARCAFGYRNPANQRLRAHCATTRRTQDTSPPAPAAVTAKLDELPRVPTSPGANAQDMTTRSRNIDKIVCARSCRISVTYY